MRTIVCFDAAGAKVTFCANRFVALVEPKALIAESDVIVALDGMNFRVKPAEVQHILNELKSEMVM